MKQTLSNICADSIEKHGIHIEYDNIRKIVLRLLIENYYVKNKKYIKDKNNIKHFKKLYHFYIDTTYIFFKPKNYSFYDIYTSVYYLFVFEKNILNGLNDIVLKYSVPEIKKLVYEINI